MPPSGSTSSYWTSSSPSAAESLLAAAVLAPSMGLASGAGHRVPGQELGHRLSDGLGTLDVQEMADTLDGAVLDLREPRVEQGPAPASGGDPRARCRPIRLPLPRRPAGRRARGPPAHQRSARRVLSACGRFGHRRRASIIQARESNHTPGSLACAARASPRRSSAWAAAAAPRRSSNSLVLENPPTHSRAAATSGP